MSLISSIFARPGESAARAQRKRQRGLVGESAELRGSTGGGFGGARLRAEPGAVAAWCSVRSQLGGYDSCSER